ncbi:UNVERIFIED_CONTAM: ABC transporter D family member 2, chloroplastic [Sesamum latifolium]|uniref:ABC transporter D family member 2, chloroplastic n=1 Tax=Sesamum latifolium TaxID=2727402 RepID=A0AAW2TQC4_9LAMI
MTSKMVGVESAAHLPPQNLYRAQAFSSASRVVFSTSQLNCSNFKHHRLYCFALSRKYSFYIDSRRRNHKDTSFSAFVCRSSLAPPQTDQEDSQRKVPDVQTLLRRFWKVAAPYWFSDDKIQARWQLAAVFALTLATTGISVGFNFLGRDFYNSLANKDQEQFTKQLLYYLASFVGGIPVSTLLHFLRYCLVYLFCIPYRTWYGFLGSTEMPNPGNKFNFTLLVFFSCYLGFNILYGIYPPLFLVLLGYSLGGTAISVYLGRGLVTLNFLQEKKEADFRYGLVRVRENAESIAFYNGEENEMQLLLQRFRSAFENLSKLLISSRNLEFFTSGYRYLIQILPAAVVAPMYFSGKIEFGVINQSVSAFNHILGDFSLIVYQFQAISAFSAVIDRLGEFDDLLTSNETRSDGEPTEEISREFCNVNNSVASNGALTINRGSKLLTVENLTLLTPSKATLIRDLSLEICEKDHLLVTGPSGSGKTSLLRAVAGLWNFGRGTIRFYDRNARDNSPCLSADAASPEATSVHEHNKNNTRNSRDVFFLPQKPYMVLGTLRQQLLYPTWNDDLVPMSESDTPTGSLPFLMRGKDMDKSPVKPTTDDLIRVLEDVRLGYIFSRFDLDSTYEWSSVLSIGEQQRLAFARLLLSKPNLVLLDESTSALDEANEAHLYKLIETTGITYISIGHRRTLYEHHKNVLHISPVEPTSVLPNWRFEPIKKDSAYNLSKQ